MMHTLRKAESFTTWLYRIARNTAYQRLRKARKFCDLHDNVVAPEEQSISSDDLPHVP